jgi:hypothetical protein
MAANSGAESVVPTTRPADPGGTMADQEVA